MPLYNQTDWTQGLTKFLKDQLQKIVEHYQGSNAQTSFLTAGPTSVVDIDNILKIWNYCTQLAGHMYEVSTQPAAHMYEVSTQLAGHMYKVSTYLAAHMYKVSTELAAHIYEVSTWPPAYMYEVSAELATHMYKVSAQLAGHMYNISTQLVSHMYAVSTPIDQQKNMGMMKECVSLYLGQYHFTRAVGCDGCCRRVCWRGRTS